MIDVHPEGLVEAICTAIRAWAPYVEAGQLRVSPNPVDSGTYLILAGTTILAQLRVLDPSLVQC